MRKGQQKPREPTKLRLVFVQLVQKTNGSSVTNFVGISQVLWGKQWKASRTNKFEHILDRKKASKLCLNVAWKYCWWKKSCTSWHILDLVINEIGYLSTSAGFLPSTVGLKKDNILAIIEPQAFGWKEPAVTSHREHVTRESIFFCLLIILSMATRNPANQLRLAVDPIIHTGFIYIYASSSWCWDFFRPSTVPLAGPFYIQQTIHQSTPSPKSRYPPMTNKALKKRMGLINHRLFP